ncbi:helical backbone metal receptor [Roseivirga seohaensis]|nr:helical backbone metal receptor [Roseivirga seohaensis]
MEGGIRIVLDQMGRKVEVPSLPQRIISLVPSQTELLYNLGLGDRVIGVTKFCIHPSQWHQSKTFVGGTKQFKFDVIDELKPDLIIGNKEENYIEGIEELAKKYPVWVSDITGLDQAFDMILAIGNLVDERAKSISIVEKVKEGFASLPYKSRRKALYLIWKKPYMAAGRATFIDEMMDFAGFENVLSETRYPELTLEAIQELAPEAILLSSEPYPFKEKHIGELKAVLPNCDVQLVDGEMFSWYGSRLMQAPSYFANLK